jgi:ketosteroid isomerase-like protein
MPDSLLRHLLETALPTFDPEVLMPLFGPDPTLEFPYAPDGLPRVVRGRDEVAGFWRSTRRMFRELIPHDVSVHPMREPGLAMATWRSTGTTGGREARPYRNSYVSMIRVSDGLIDRYCEYYDPLAGMRAFGRA